MLPLRLLLAVFGATFGGSLLYGYNIGVLNNINDVCHRQLMFATKSATVYLLYSYTYFSTVCYAPVQYKLCYTLQFTVLVH